jgi:putative Mg2+ transporter-C (MgtC) family protein
MELLTILYRLGAAAILSGLIGIERDIHGRAAGLRTNMLISIGAASFMLLAESLAGSISGFDISKMSAQVISGVGFIGAGAILKNQYSVRGLTTAATIWICAAIGLTSGGGKYILAISVTLISLFCLIGLEFLEQRYARDFFRTLIIETTTEIQITRIRELLDIPRITLVSHETENNYETGRQTIQFQIRLRDRDEKADTASIIEVKMKSADVPVFKIALRQ